MGQIKNCIFFTVCLENNNLGLQARERMNHLILYPFIYAGYFPLNCRKGQTHHFHFFCDGYY